MTQAQLRNPLPTRLFLTDRQPRSAGTAPDGHGVRTETGEGGDAGAHSHHIPGHTQFLWLITCIRIFHCKMSSHATQSHDWVRNASEKNHYFIQGTNTNLRKKDKMNKTLLLPPGMGTLELGFLFEGKIQEEKLRD